MKEEIQYSGQISFNDWADSPQSYSKNYKKIFNTPDAKKAKISKYWTTYNLKVVLVRNFYTISKSLATAITKFCAGESATRSLLIYVNQTLQEKFDGPKGKKEEEKNSKQVTVTDFIYIDDIKVDDFYPQNGKDNYGEHINISKEIYKNKTKKWSAFWKFYVHQQTLIMQTMPILRGQNHGLLCL